MKHAREDYSRIQDPEGKIPDDEPVFLLRGQDKHAARVVRFYADLVDSDDGDPKIIKRSRDQAVQMENWRVHKAPDL